MKSVHLLILFFTNFVLAQTNADSLIIKNKVKEVRILNQENIVAGISRYDESGRLVYRALDDFDGAPKIKQSIEWFYDKEGKRIKTIFNHSGYNYSTIWVYDYDGRGNMITTKTDAGELVFQYFYNESDFLVKKLAFNNDTISHTTMYEKTDNGKKIVEKSVRKDKSIGRVNITYFDDNGNTIKSESYDGDKVNFSASYVYEKNKIIKSIEHLGGGHNYIYDNTGKLIKSIVFKIKDNIEIDVDIDEFAYDEKGLIILYEQINAGGILKAYRYEYDFYN